MFFVNDRGRRGSRGTNSFLSFRRRFCIYENDKRLSNLAAPRPVLPNVRPRAPPAQNEKTLSRIGADALEKMLRLRDWSDVEGMKVDRRDMEALRVANDLQVDGAVKAEDSSFAFDSTPAANRVDRGQIDGGDMVNVILQALEIRLGGGGGRDDDGRRRVGGGGPSLNGAQTSAAMMASDFLLDELERIAEECPGDSKAPVLDDVVGGGSRSRGGYAAADGFDVEDYDDEEAGALSFGSGRELEDAEMSALFGMGGIKIKSDDY